jgi:hypothetical protein
MMDVRIIMNDEKDDGLENVVGSPALEGLVDCINRGFCSAARDPPLYIE